MMAMMMIMMIMMIIRAMTKKWMKKKNNPVQQIDTDSFIKIICWNNQLLTTFS